MTVTGVPVTLTDYPLLTFPVSVTHGYFYLYFPMKTVKKYPENSNRQKKRGEWIYGQPFTSLHKGGSVNTPILPFLPQHAITGLTSTRALLSLNHLYTLDFLSNLSILRNNIKSCFQIKLFLRLNLSRNFFCLEI